MERFQANREMVLKVESDLLPKIRKRLYREKMGSNRWLACWAGHIKFEVKNMLESFTMDLDNSKCSYRKWDITGIPCAHAISCIFFNREEAKKYVHDCYKVTTYKACYEPLQANTTNNRSAPPTSNTTTNRNASPHSADTIPNPSQKWPKKKSRAVTVENLIAIGNASRYMRAMRFAESQASVHGPRRH